MPAPAEAAPPPAADALLPRAARVVGRRRETADTVTLTIEDGGGGAALPGQFTMLLAPGHSEVAVSVSADPGDGVREQTVRAVGAATRAVTSLAAGDLIGVRGPFGAPWPMHLAEGGDVVVVAGGIGLAPLRPAVHEVLARRERFGRFHVLYGARTPDDLVFRSELARWRQRFDTEVGVSVDTASTGWHGHVGVVTRLIARAGLAPAAGATALVCGPEVMMRFAAAALVDAGVVPERIWVSLERGMTCGVGRCGRCQLGPVLVCRDGPVLRLDRVAPLWATREL